MFTGLVQALGVVDRVRDDGHGGRLLRVREPGIGPYLSRGESVAVNGACLTVVERAGDSFGFQAGPETLSKTNLGTLTVGDRVNLERALRVGDALGGHFVTGHVDCIGRIAERVPNGDWQTIWFEFPAGFDELLVEKGSVALDGVSLTVVDVQPGRLSVMLIPHTLANTTIGLKPVGAAVNLEFDLLAKHVRKLFQSLALPR
ncbi:MAG TPA: riboflavin synthase [Fimbriiglobus sp.]|nr:riboflavin synthase [Fimbriiglobus sp.]